MIIELNETLKLTSLKTVIHDKYKKTKWKANVLIMVHGNKKIREAAKKCLTISADRKKVNNHN